MQILENNNKNKSLTVSKCANTINQSYGGYLKRKDFKTINFGGYFIDNKEENIEPTTAGLVVDYLVRYKLTKNKKEAFEIPLIGAGILLDYYWHDPEYGNILFNEAHRLLENINLNLDDETIISACKITEYSIIYRVSPREFDGVNLNHITPNKRTIKQIRELVNRSLNIFKKFGGVIDVGFDFKGAYTEQITNGDADFLSPKILWNMKNIKGDIGQNHTMQLLIYWRLGMKSEPNKFSKVKYLGIVNPRKNETYLYDLSNISKELVEFIDKEVIGY